MKRAKKTRKLYKCSSYAHIVLRICFVNFLINIKLNNSFFFVRHYKTSWHNAVNETIDFYHHL